MITMGIDIGSTSSKAVIMEDGNRVLAKHVVQLGIGTDGPENAYKAALEQACLIRENIDCILATGYGRMTFPEADCQSSELVCHGKGMHYLIPGIHTVVDIGGQDAKVLQINDHGALQTFVMNDKCAAGTGRFLDVMAKVLNVKVWELGKISFQAKKELHISNVCTVFAESEVISHLAAGESIPDIVAGIHRSVAKRVAGLGNRIGFRSDIAMSGGVALNQGVVAAMEREVKCEVKTHPDAQLAGAYGAALIAYEKNR